MITKQEKSIGKRIKKFRKKEALTQENLAEKVNLSAKYIQFIETGRRVPSLKALCKIAHALRVDPSDLVTF
jgi:transcriptional regulator with XRE-family HTH domain